PDTTKIWEDASSRKLDHHLSENLLNHANDPIDDSFGFKEIDPTQKQKKRKSTRKPPFKGDTPPPPAP
ncbi:MAG: hypothetical protein U9N14_03060, partial [Pseudomonadota bacterium]|nr:hypothetical protein [Pseudomonadota bacterium]